MNDEVTSTHSSSAPRSRWNRGVSGPGTSSNVHPDGGSVCSADGQIVNPVVGFDHLTHGRGPTPRPLRAKSHPRWTAAAWTAAPAATSSSSDGTSTTRPVRSATHATVGGAAGRSADEEHPSRRRSGSRAHPPPPAGCTPRPRRRRGRAGPGSRRCGSPRACRWRRGRFGVRSPSRCGTSTSPDAPAGASSARCRIARGRPRAAASRVSVTLVAFIVQTSGR